MTLNDETEILHSVLNVGPPGDKLIKEMVWTHSVCNARFSLFSLTSLNGLHHNYYPLLP